MQSMWPAELGRFSFPMLDHKRLVRMFHFFTIFEIKNAQGAIGGGVWGKNLGAKFSLFDYDVILRLHASIQISSYRIFVNVV